MHAYRYGRSGSHAEVRRRANHAHVSPEPGTACGRRCAAVGRNNAVVAAAAAAAAADGRPATAAGAGGARAQPAPSGPTEPAGPADFVRPIPACCNRCAGVVGTLATGETPLLNHSLHRVSACLAACASTTPGGSSSEACTKAAFLAGDLDAAHCPLGQLDKGLADLLGVSSSGRPAKCVEQYLRDAGIHAALVSVGARLRAGLPTAVTVLGGSVTAGTGASPSHNSYPRVLERSLRAYFPETPISVSTFAYSGTGTRYWLACPDGKITNQTHLVVIDVAINDNIGTVREREKNLRILWSKSWSGCPSTPGPWLT